MSDSAAKLSLLVETQLQVFERVGGVAAYFLGNAGHRISFDGQQWHKNRRNTSNNSQHLLQYQRIVLGGVKGRRHVARKCETTEGEVLLGEAVGSQGGGGAAVESVRGRRPIVLIRI